MHITNCRYALLTCIMGSFTLALILFSTLTFTLFADTESDMISVKSNIQLLTKVSCIIRYKWGTNKHQNKLTLSKIGFLFCHLL
jgi:hypothetical protein